MVSHTTEVYGCADFAHIFYLLDVNRAKLILNTLWLACRELAAWFYHIDTYFTSVSTDDVHDVKVVSLWVI